MRWTEGVSRFVDTGNSSLLCELAMNTKASSTGAWMKLVTSMDNYSRLIAACRGKSLSEGANSVFKALEELKEKH